MEVRKLIPLLVLLASCQAEQWDDCITSTGPMRAEERSVALFTAIDLDDRVDVIFEQRPAGSLVVEAGRNLLGQVTTEVEGSTLTLRSDMRCNWVRSFKPRITVHVPVTGIGKITVRGTGNITCTDTLIASVLLFEQWGGQGSATLLVKVDRLDAALHTGAGDITLLGRCTGSANLFSGLMAPIDARALQANDVNVNNSGVSDIRCRVAGHLDVGINGVGNVYYSGEPTGITTQITGTGQLIREP
jgi:hypothetical protein